jgi:hypothetical protein
MADQPTSAIARENGVALMRSQPRKPRLHRGCRFCAPSGYASVQASSAEYICESDRNAPPPVYDGAFPCTGGNSCAPLGRPDSALRNDGVGGSNPSCGTMLKYHTKKSLAVPAFQGRFPADSPPIAKSGALPAAPGPAPSPGPTFARSSPKVVAASTRTILISERRSSRQTRWHHTQHPDQSVVTANERSRRRYATPIRREN